MKIDKSHKPLPATTTQQEDVVTAGQRAINMLWENTQSHIAKVTVYSTISVNVIVVIALISLRQVLTVEMITVVLASLGSLNTITGIIIGFYFGRTNHSAIGGVGKKPDQGKYVGR